jgi:hypothetical protein
MSSRTMGAVRIINGKRTISINIEVLNSLCFFFVKEHHMYPALFHTEIALI